MYSPSQQTGLNMNHNQDSSTGLDQAIQIIMDRYDKSQILSKGEFGAELICEDFEVTALLYSLVFEAADSADNDIAIARLIKSQMRHEMSLEAARLIDQEPELFDEVKYCAIAAADARRKDEMEQVA